MAKSKYNLKRNRGNIIVGDAALDVFEYLSIPVFDTDDPSIGGYTDYDGRIFWNRINERVYVRKEGVWQSIVGAPYSSNDFSKAEAVNGIVYNIYDQYSGVPFNATIFEDITPGFVVDNCMWFDNPAHLGGGFLHRNYEFELHSEWFGLVGDNSTDNTAGWIKAMAYLEARGGGSISIGVGTFIIDGFSLPIKVTIRGVSVGGTILKLKANSTKTYLIDCNIAYSGSIENMTIQGDRANQTIENHGIGLRAVGGNSNYMFMSRRLLIEEFKGNGIHAISPSFIFMVQTVRIRNNDGYGIYNTSTDNGFADFLISLNKKGGIFNDGNNTRYLGGKILFNGDALYPDSAGIFESSSRSQYSGIECQENYYHGVYLSSGTYCNMNFVSDMNNVARRPISLGGLNNIGDPTAIGYALKMVNSQNNLIQGTIVSSVLDGNLKYTQFGKSIDGASINNTFILKEQLQYGPDNVLSGGNNTWIKHQQFSNPNTDADFTVLMNNPNVRLNVQITADRQLVLPTAPESTQKRIVIYNQNSLSSAFHWIPSQPIKDFNNVDIAQFPNSSVIVLEQIQSGVSSATAQWRIASLYSDLYTKADVDALTKKAKTIVLNGGSSYTVTDADYVGTNGEVDIILNAVGNFTIVLPLLANSAGRKISVVRIDSGNATVSVKGRTTTLPNFEPVNGDDIVALQLFQDRPISLIYGSSIIGGTGYGWWTTTYATPKEVIITTDPGVAFITRTKLNADFNIAKYGIGTTVYYTFLGMSFKRMEPTVWIEQPYNITPP